MLTYGLILILGLARTLAGDDPEQSFKAVGEEMDIGFCFGVDYMTLLRLTDEGKQLVANSSDPFSPPESYKNRINTTHSVELLGMQVEDLRLSDSGVYISECWRDNELVNHHTQHLRVCDKEISSQKILFLPNYGADLECDRDYSEQDHASIIWFRKMYPGHKSYLILDTRKSQELLQEELKDLIQVQKGGYALHISEAALKSSRNFTCLVMDGEQCKGFQNMYLPVEVLNVYYAAGEKAVLSCGSEHPDQKQTYWKTPFGEMSSTTPHDDKGAFGSQLSISVAEDTGDYSLVIPFTTHNHSGEYMCLSALALRQYFVTVCSELELDEFQLDTGGQVTLTCTQNKNESANIQWFRQRDPKELELICDSGDPSVTIPDDLNDRMLISESEISLTISELTEQDSGTYWCVVLLDIEDMFDYPTEDEDVESEWLEDEESTDLCILKRVIQLKSQSISVPRFIPDLNTESVTNQGLNPEYPSDSSPEAEPGSSPLPYAVIGGVLGIVILGLIIAVAVVKKRAKRKDVSSSTAEPQQPETSAPLMSLQSLPRNSENIC